MTTMQLVDRIEKRRFVGREFLLFLWFEAETFEATLSTKKHGSFGLWVERLLLLSAGKEMTRIKGSYPSASREAKESLAAGKLPEAAGIHLAWGDRDISFTLKAERLAISGLSLPTVLGGQEETTPALLEARPPPRRKKRSGPDEERERESDERHEAFYERMSMTREVEGLVEALYRDFLALRLGPAWGELVLPALASWVAGEPPAAEEYREGREGALAARPVRAASPAASPPRKRAGKKK